jgi:hypothetical protein
VLFLSSLLVFVSPFSVVTFHFHPLWLWKKYTIIVTTATHNRRLPPFDFDVSLVSIRSNNVTLDEFRSNHSECWCNSTSTEEGIPFYLSGFATPNVKESFISTSTPSFLYRAACCSHDPILVTSRYLLLARG